MKQSSDHTTVNTNDFDIQQSRRWFPTVFHVGLTNRQTTKAFAQIQLQPREILRPLKSVRESGTICHRRWRCG